MESYLCYRKPYLSPYYIVMMKMFEFSISVNIRFNTYGQIFIKTVNKNWKIIT